MGSANRRSQHIRQFLPSEALEQLLPAIHRARHGDRINAVLRHGAKTFALEQFDIQPGWRPAARVQTVEFSRLRVVDEGKQVAADAIGHRRDHTHHGIGRHGRIGGCPAALEHGHSGLRGQRRLRSHNPVPRDRHRTRLPAVLRLEVAGRHLESHRQPRQENDCQARLFLHFPA